MKTPTGRAIITAREGILMTDKLKSAFFFVIILAAGAVFLFGKKIDVTDKIIEIFTGEKIAGYALSLRGTAYRHGGNDKEYGFDCSGFTQHVYARFGIIIPRMAAAQYELSEKSPINNAKKGDLVFFNTRGLGPTHVGIYLGKGKFIHAPGAGKQVRVDSLFKKYWSAVFICAGKYL